MLLSQVPKRIALAFAALGGKNNIPEASQIGVTAGAASYTDGFPPATRTPLVSGGTPPSGLDMNGVLFEATALSRWMSAGGGIPYSAAFATDPNVGGYPKGARLLAADGSGYWLSLADNNATDPDAGGANWVPQSFYGETSLVMVDSNVTLSATVYGRPLITITGALTANLNLFLPALVGEWAILNRTTGAFTITGRTTAGTGVVLPQGETSVVFGDGANIVTGRPVTLLAAPADADNSLKIASTGWVRSAMANIATAAGFVASFTANGYVQFPTWFGKLLLQWGFDTSPAGGVKAISFPISFASTPFFSVANADSGTFQYANVSNPGGATGLTVTVWNSSASTGSSSQFKWFSLGVGV